MNKAIAIREILNHEIDESKLTRNQLHMWALSASGIGLSGYDLFIMSVALPLVQTYFNTFSPIMAGLFAGAGVFGAIPGALGSGILSDRFGRRAILLINIAMLAMTSILCAIAWNPLALLFFRFLQGIAIGAEYPISSALVAEVMPRKNRGKWVTGAFSFQAVGMALAAIVSTLILLYLPNDNAWRWMMLSCTIPSLIVAIMRRNLRESPRWLARKGLMKKAEDSLQWLIGLEAVESIHHQVSATLNIDQSEPTQGRLSNLFNSKFRIRTLLTAIPWFLMDTGLYGIGLFSPTILAHFIQATPNYTGGFIASDFKADTSAAIADLFLVIGFALNIFSVEHLGRIKLQILGFAGMAIGTAIIGLFGASSHTFGMILGFLIFNFMVNFGPNATTFLLPVEVFPTQLRSTGHGFAAACGKIGATTGVFLLPLAAHTFGITPTMTVIGILSLIGAVVTLLCRIETQGLALE